MARWKAHVEFLLSVIELLFLSLTVEALLGKMCQNSLPSGVGRWLGAKISGGRGRPWGIFFGFYKTRLIVLSTVQTAPCYVPLFWQYWRVTDRRTDRRTDGRNCLSQGLKCAGSHRVADPAHFDLLGLYRVSRSLVYSYSAWVHLWFYSHFTG